MEAEMDTHTNDRPTVNRGPPATQSKDAVTHQELTNLVNFLRTIGDDTPPVRSATDEFLEQNTP
jgi:hypothetical protein